MRKREYDQVVIPQSPSKFSHYKTENRLREFEDEDMMDTNSQTGYSVDSRGQPKMKAMSLYKSNLDSQVPRMSQGENAGIITIHVGRSLANRHSLSEFHMKALEDARWIGIVE